MREAIQYDVIIDFLLIGLIDLFIFHRLSLTEFFHLTPTVPEFLIILSVFIVCINIIITIKIFSSLAFNSFLIKSNIDELFSNYFILAPPSFPCHNSHILFSFHHTFRVDFSIIMIDRMGNEKKHANEHRKI